MMVGVFCINHLFGIIGLVFMSGIDFSKAFLGDLIFIPGDMVKIVLAYLIASRLRKALPDLMEANQ